MQQNVPARFGTHQFGLGGHEGVRQATHEILLVRAGFAAFLLLIGLHELPPTHPLVLLLAALVTARDELPEFVGKQVDVGLGETRIGVGNGAEDYTQIVAGFRKIDDTVDRGFAKPGQHHALRHDEIVEDPVGVARKRNALHSVGNVFVKAREKPESVLAGQGLAATLSGVFGVHAAGLATHVMRLFFVHVHVETPFHKFVGGAHATDAAAQDGHLNFHSLIELRIEKAHGILWPGEPSNGQYGPPPDTRSPATKYRHKAGMFS